ncbi:GNAT family N-acetyltransferase [Inquilinus sp. YAF38]|uniref:GNAT family N-acetyltransferase n=1 Tax=Inquilinus sp. YAF38 TaxID=3233084 RepID=UPI003F8F0D37
MILTTPRLRLRPWREDDRAAFAALAADPEVMRDLGGPLDRAGSDAKLDRTLAAFDRHGFCRWAVESLANEFLGYAGIMRLGPDHPLGSGVEIGWRLMRLAWGRGYATEAAAAALQDGFGRLGFGEILACTAPDNLRSQAVMARLSLRRDPARDFTASYDGAAWHGLVWVARPSMGY